VTVTALLHSALRGPCRPPLRLLPARGELQAPPRLAAHLRLVHDVACQLADWAAIRHPALGYDRDAMLFGAATHDIGKAAFPAEITGPGSAHECCTTHEEAGRQLAEIRDNLIARFAEAQREGWTGEAEGLQVSLAAAGQKLAQMDEITARRHAAPVHLGMPGHLPAAGRTVTTPATLPGHTR
jgi:hypothetical protein